VQRGQAGRGAAAVGQLLLVGDVRVGTAGQRGLLVHLPPQRHGQPRLLVDLPLPVGDQAGQLWVAVVAQRGALGGVRAHREEQSGQQPHHRYQQRPAVAPDPPVRQQGACGPTQGLAPRRRTRSVCHRRPFSLRSARPAPVSAAR
jgi:hypothetical protein